MLLDSNIIIYSVMPEHEVLRQMIERRDCVASVISYVEVLGFTKLTAQDQNRFASLFRAWQMLPVTRSIAEEAADLRQQRRMSLGGANVAATAYSTVCLSLRTTHRTSVGYPGWS